MRAVKNQISHNSKKKLSSAQLEYWVCLFTIPEKITDKPSKLCDKENKFLESTHVMKWSTRLI